MPGAGLSKSICSVLLILIPTNKRLVLSSIVTPSLPSSLSYQASPAHASKSLSRRKPDGPGDRESSLGRLATMAYCPGQSSDHWLSHGRERYRPRAWLELGAKRLWGLCLRRHPPSPYATSAAA